MKRSIPAARYILVNRKELFMRVLPFSCFFFFFVRDSFKKKKKKVACSSVCCKQHHRKRMRKKPAEILICVSADLRQKVECDDSGSVSERKCFAVFPSFQARSLPRSAWDFHENTPAHGLLFSSQLNMQWVFLFCSGVRLPGWHSFEHSKTGKLSEDAT